jgi:heme-degrading monooxygenase HmoA
MIKHLVFWKLKESAQGNDKTTNAQLIKEKLEALKGLPGLLELEVGLDYVHGPASADVVLYTVFESQEALDAYQVHPSHVAARDFIVTVVSDRQVVDYAC